MADGVAEADIRGINVDKLAKGFADEALILKQFLTVSNTTAREIRWYKKTAGYLDNADTTAVTASDIKNTAFKARPVVIGQTWTRQTSYVRKYMAESEWIPEEDIKDTDIDILATTIRDITLAVGYQVEKRIYDVVSDDDAGTGVPGADSTVPTAGATGTGWDDATNGNAILDIMAAKTSMRNYNYDPEGAIMLLHPDDHKFLINYLISIKGSSIPAFSSEKVKDGTVMEVLGVRVIVSSNFVTDYAVLFVPQRAVSWKQFMPITATTITDEGIGRKVRVWEEGEALLTDPNACYIISDTQT